MSVIACSRHLPAVRQNLPAFGGSQNDSARRFPKDGYFLIRALSVFERDCRSADWDFRADVIVADRSPSEVACLRRSCSALVRFHEIRILVGVPAIHLLRIELTTLH